MSNLSVFVFESQEVRFVGTPEKLEWVAADVCAILDIDTSVAINGRKRKRTDGSEYFDGGLEVDEKGTAIVSTPGGEQEMLTVTEPGLYRLIFKSHKPVAKRFQRWVFHEVLPSLRRTGYYSIPKPDRQHNGRLTLDELLSFAQKVLAPTRLSPELQTITVVRGLQAMYPEIAPMASELVGAIGETIATSLRHVSPTTIGELYAQQQGLPKPIKPHIVNRVLEETGLQYKEVEFKTDSNGKPRHKNIWHLTEAGKQWRTVKLDKARTHDKIVEHVRWLPDVLNVIDLSKER
ncbi:BRO family protein [Nostoc sp. FACHB-190]|uniref:BRO-N domain-containing protein n=1 Tax=Nostoc sp. FACHB-190 TaxID=2692838 RepID=UPI001688FEE4|nr:BRO family protein [Nostoc sp. FACHB-190]MBD2302863.1 hypothetical protein [Nostoc sp. FACHB-190]